LKNYTRRNIPLGKHIARTIEINNTALAACTSSAANGHAHIDKCAGTGLHRFTTTATATTDRMRENTG
jgi:hypothetical protein